jgi:hypothetical protein
MKKYENIASVLMLEIQTLINELKKQQITLENLKKYRVQKNKIKKTYNSTVVNFRQETGFKKNQVPKVRNMNKPLRTFEEKLKNSIQKVQILKKTNSSNVSEILSQDKFNYSETAQVKKLFKGEQQISQSRRLNLLLKLKRKKVSEILNKPLRTFEEKLKNSIQKVQILKKTNSSNVSEILSQDKFNYSETAQVKKLFQGEQQINQSRRLNLLLKLKRKKVSEILTYENAVKKERQKRAAVVKTQYNQTAAVEKLKVQSLLKNSGIKVSQSNSTSQKKISVS